MMRELVNAGMDKLVRTHIRVSGCRQPAFRTCGGIGLVLAIALSLGLARARGLEMGVVFGLALVCIVSFLALAMARKIVCGGERLVYYHHEIAAILAAVAFLLISRRSVLPYLDITILGVGVFLACGRMGCLLVGCCHGRPALWGPRYRSEHVAVGFESCFRGVRLFPVAGLEALCVLMIVTVGLVFVVEGRPPGDSLAWYTVTYAVARFGFEYLRGDAGRSYWKGSSEAQWTSLGLACLAVLAELAGRLPFRPWHLLCPAFLLVLTMFNALLRTAPRQLVHTKHIREIAETISQLGTRAKVSSEIHVQVTSLGLRISSGIVSAEGDQIEHYSFSRQNGGLESSEARALAALLLRLRPDSASGTIVKGREGVFHLIIGRDQCLGSA
jgi:hypothetical protein